MDGWTLVALTAERLRATEGIVSNIVDKQFKNLQ